MPFPFSLYGGPTGSESPYPSVSTVTDKAQRAASFPGLSPTPDGCWKMSGFSFAFTILIVE